MRTRILLLFLLFTTTANAQQFTGQRKSVKGIVCPFEDYIGTWQYVSSLPEYAGSKWEDRDNIDPRRSRIKDL